MQVLQKRLNKTPPTHVQDGGGELLNSSKNC